MIERLIAASSVALCSVVVLTAGSVGLHQLTLAAHSWVRAISFAI